MGGSPYLPVFGIWRFSGPVRGETWKIRPVSGTEVAAGAGKIDIFIRDAGILPYSRWREITILWRYGDIYCYRTHTCFPCFLFKLPLLFAITEVTPYPSKYTTLMAQNIWSVCKPGFYFGLNKVKYIFYFSHWMSTINIKFSRQDINAHKINAKGN